MKLKQYVNSILNRDISQELISKGIGYEVCYLKKYFVVQIRLYGSVKLNVFGHIEEQIRSYKIDKRVDSILLDLNEPFTPIGKIWPLRKRAVNTIHSQFVVVLLRDWSKKANHIRFLNLMGYANMQFFFSYETALKWIAIKLED